MAPLLLAVCTALLVTLADTEELNFRLSHDILPSNYRLDIQPHFEDNNFTFYGQVWIDVVAKVNATNVTLHSSKELEILEATVSKRKKALDKLPPPTKLLGYSKLEGTRGGNNAGLLTLVGPFKRGNQYRLKIRYRGRLSDTLTGFYRTSYLDVQNNTRWLAATTFEPNEARSAYPCFDEPGFKARFLVNIASQGDAVALSNMPRHSKHNATDAPGWVWNRFEETPPVSTYLVAFFVGHLESRETRTANGTLFRVWARPEVITQTQLALDIGPRLLQYFSTLLEVPEPLPKHDLLALPRFVADALENWGLISFGEKYLLHENGEIQRRKVASIMAHELAHSWFGNMVSVRWWEDIWLNEGFATYLAALGEQHIDPNWDSISVTTVSAFLNVFSVDSLQSSHALTVTISRQSELRQIFDTVTYYKGYYLLRMLSHALGEKTFLKGCGRYVKEHMFKTVDQNDLWKALTKQAHEDKVLSREKDLAVVMEAWTSRPGFPVITVTRNYSDGTAVVSQTRFERPIEDVEARQNHGGLWWVPLTYTAEDAPDFNKTAPRLWLDPNEEEIQIADMPGPDHWVLFNIQAAGLYRVNYDLENWALISQFLNSPQYSSMSVLNRALLQDDALDLARVGLLPYPVALNITSYLRQENHYLPWKSALSNLEYLAHMLRLTEALSSYKRYIQYLVDPQFENLGFESHKNDSYLKNLHRNEVIRWACLAGHPECVNKATTLFNTWMNSLVNTIPGTLRSTLYCTAVNQGGPEQWQFLWSSYRNSTSVSERNRILMALGCSEDTETLKSYLRTAVQSGSGVKPGDSVTIFKAVASSDTGFSIAKNFFINNIDVVEKAVGSFQVSKILEIIASRMNQPSHLEQLEDFQRRNAFKLEQFTRTVNQVTEKVRYNIDWLERNYLDISTWLNRR